MDGTASHPIRMRAGRPIWTSPDPGGTLLVHVIDQRSLPAHVSVLDLASAADAADAIRNMAVRGAPLIGATAAWGLALAAFRASPGQSSAAVEAAAVLLGSTRPTAQDLHGAINRQMVISRAAADDASRMISLEAGAEALCEESVAACRIIGEHGLSLIESAARRIPDRPVNILTHCNAGWLACVAHGTATAPIYLAHRMGIRVHVWVDETRPRNQGAALTAWELSQGGVPHTLVTDNAGGHLMQHGLVDMVLVGADRITRRGDVANKIGTYLKALAARDNGVPFYVAAPTTTFDLAILDGIRDIPIEHRDPAEVCHIAGTHAGRLLDVRICPPETPACNPAFDVTPARLVDTIITNRGLIPASEEAIRGIFPEWEQGHP